MINNSIKRGLAAAWPKAAKGLAGALSGPMGPLARISPPLPSRALVFGAFPPLAFLAGAFLALALWPAAPLQGASLWEPPVLAGSCPSGFSGLKGEGAEFRLWPAARANPYNLGNCFQWRGCRGETIGNMPVPVPDYCGPLGGKSWRSLDGRCVDLPSQPWPADSLGGEGDRPPGVGDW
jgi:hypothetical protein